MRGLRKLMCAAALPLILGGLAAGCGGNNTYNPDLVNLLPDFIVTVYRGTAGTVGNGTGQTANSQGNPAGVDTNATTPMTVVVKSANGFAGAVNVSAGAPTGPFTVTQPTPASMNVAAGGSADAEFTVSTSNSAVAGNTGSVVVTVTSGNTSHTYTAYFTVNQSQGSPDFTVTLYNGTPASIGDGSDSTPNSQQNRASSLLGQTRPITVVVKSVNGFTGNVDVTVADSSGPFAVNQPVPVTINIPAGSFKDTSFTFMANEGAQPGQTGAATVSVTNGQKTHGATAYLVVGSQEN